MVTPTLPLALSRRREWATFPSGFKTITSLALSSSVSLPLSLFLCLSFPPPPPTALPFHQLPASLTSLLMTSSKNTTTCRLPPAGNVTCQCAPGFQAGTPSYCMPSCPMVPAVQGVNTSSCGVAIGAVCPLQCPNGTQIVANDGTGLVIAALSEVTCMAEPKAWSATCR